MTDARTGFAAQRAMAAAIVNTAAIAAQAQLCSGKSTETSSTGPTIFCVVSPMLKAPRYRARAAAGDIAKDNSQLATWWMFSATV